MAEYGFNIDNGYLEGLVRGFKGGILRQADYLNLVQCDTLEGVSACFFSGCHRCVIVTLRLLTFMSQLLQPPIYCDTVRCGILWLISHSLYFNPHIHV